MTELQLTSIFCFTACILLISAIARRGGGNKKVPGTFLLDSINWQIF